MRVVKVVVVVVVVAAARPYEEVEAFLAC